MCLQYSPGRTSCMCISKGMLRQAPWPVQRARILDIMSPTSPRCQPSGQQPAQRAPSGRPASSAPQSIMVSPDAKGAVSQVTHHPMYVAVHPRRVTEEVCHACRIRGS